MLDVGFDSFCPLESAMDVLVILIQTSKQLHMMTFSSPTVLSFVCMMQPITMSFVDGNLEPHM